MEIQTWEISEDLKQETSEHYRARFSSRVSAMPPLEIVKSVTFDSVAPNLTIPEVRKFIDFIDRRILHGMIAGRGFEVGAGCGVFCALLGTFSKVEKMYGIEVCEPIVRDLMPRIVPFIAGETNSKKIIGCIGDFDRIELPSNSMDFAFDFFSLHHSSNLKKTFSEIRRVLKPDGFIFCFDKARDDRLTDALKEKLLDREYPSDAKRNMGIDPLTRFTRRMNGEKEYCLREWREAFLESGFSRFEHYHVARCASGNPLIKKAKELFSLFPPRLQAKISDPFVGSKWHANSISRNNEIYSTLITNFPKEISLMVAYK